MLENGAWMHFVYVCVCVVIVQTCPSEKGHL